MTERKHLPTSLLSWPLLRRALWESVLKLNPRHQIRNPVIFTVLVGSVLSTAMFLQSLTGPAGAPPWFIGAVAVALWFTVLFANLAEAIAEGRGKAHADSLRAARSHLQAKRLDAPLRSAGFRTVPSGELRKGDFVLVETEGFIPNDGEVVEGAAYVDESAVTGESAPVVRESGGDRSAVTGGTRVLSDWLIVRITADPGENFLDRMINLVEAAKGRKLPTRSRWESCWRH